MLSSQRSSLRFTLLLFKIGRIRIGKKLCEILSDCPNRESGQSPEANIMEKLVWNEGFAGKTIDLHSIDAKTAGEPLDYLYTFCL